MAISGILLSVAGALAVGGIATTVVVTSGPFRSSDADNTAAATVPTGERHTPGHPEGSLPSDEAGRLKAGAVALADVVQVLAAAGEWELARADIHPDEEGKFPECSASRCADLEFILWSTGESLLVVVDRTSGATVLPPARGSRAGLTQALRAAAIEIAISDPEVQKLAGQNLRGGPSAADVSRPGICQRELCAQFAVTGERSTVGVRVSLTRRSVIFISAATGVVRDEG